MDRTSTKKQVEKKHPVAGMPFVVGMDKLVRVERQQTTSTAEDHEADVADDADPKRGKETQEGEWGRLGVKQQQNWELTINGEVGRTSDGMHLLLSSSLRSTQIMQNFTAELLTLAT